MNWIGRTAVIGFAFSLGCAPPSKLEQAAQDAAEILERAAEKGAEQSATKDLQAVWESYMNHHDVHRQGPANWEELIQYATESQGDVAAIQRAKDKGVQVTWGVKLSSLTQGSANTVFAQGGGGPTMMFDRSVR